MISLDTVKANRYKNPSSTKNYFLTTAAVEQSDTKAVTYHKRARNAAYCSHPVIEDSTLNVATACSVPVSLVDGMKEKRKAIKDEGLRHGRRAMNHKGNEQLTTRLRSAQRKSTLHMAEIHPELKFIRDKIIKSEDGSINIEAA